MLGLLLVGLLAGAYASWHFSSRVLVPEHPNWPEDISVEEVSPRRIVLERDEDTLRPGVYGLDWQSGHAVIGRVLGSDEHTVTRRLLDTWGYLVAGEKVAVDSSVYAGNPRQARGLPFKTVSIPGELGPMRAWYIPAAAPANASPGHTAPPPGDGAEQTPATWAIVVHGINDDPQVGLRLAPTLRAAGLASLLITYREDLGAPQSPDGFHHMGLTEWRDLQAAALYALSHGAHSLVLVGYSMGGSLVTQFMQHSRLADRVRGLILDAPALSWPAILSYNATEMGLPGFTAKPVEWAIGARIDADWDDLDALDHTDDLELPILLFHGLDDTVVPVETSDELAAKLPRWVAYHRLPHAEHTQSWNVDPALYQRRVQAFLAATVVPSGAKSERGSSEGTAAAPDNQPEKQTSPAE